MKAQKMTYTATITKSGQVTLPKVIRDLLNVKIGERVDFDVDKKTNEVFIKRKLTPEEVAEKLDSMTSPETKIRIQKLGGKPFDEIREKIYNDEPDQEEINYYKEKYGF